MSFVKPTIALVAFFMLPIAAAFAGGVGAGNQLPSNAKSKASGSPEVKDQGKSAGGSMQKGGSMGAGGSMQKGGSMKQGSGKM